MSVPRKKEEAYLTDNWLEATVEDLKDLIQNRANGFIRNILEELHPADIAEISSHLSSNDRLYLFSLLDPEVASEVLIEIDQPLQSEILEQIDDTRISQVVEEMESDDAADIVAALPDNVAEKVLDSIDTYDSAEVRELLAHEEDTAGGIMAKEFVAVNEDLTVDQAIQIIRHMAEEIDEIYNVFVVDDENKLVGVLPLQDLLLTRSGVKVHHVMNDDVIYVGVHVDQEEVANLFKKYDLISLPVVDDEKKLIGRITIDDIVDVMEEEASEDAQKIAGITDLDITETSPLRVTRSRLPWLIVSFIGEVITGYLMSRFEISMTKVLSIVFFVPLIMAVGGNVGNQSAIVIIRGLATGEIGLLETGRRIKNELWIALLLGLFLAVGIQTISGLWLKDFVMGLAIAVSLILVVLNAAMMGTLLPFVLRRLKIDPAVATSPFITTSNDILGLLIYFGTISLFLKYFY